MSIVLLCGVLYGALRAAMLCSIPANRVANRFLAALIVVLMLYSTPYVIGYAGYYDAYPWLSFAPYNTTLAIGPLLYLYVRCVPGDALPARWRWHFLPVLFQFLYYCIVFFQPLAFKNHWNGAVHLPYVSPFESLALAISLLAYGRLAMRLRAATDAVAGEWMRNLRVAVGLTIVAWLTMTFCEYIGSGLSYFQRFPFYLWLSILVGYLGTEGYRQTPTPAPVPAAAELPDVPDMPAIASPTSNVAEQGARWRATIITEKWWRDPDLTMAVLARRLGTNTTALSRAMNNGLGLNFNELMNRLRVDAVVEALHRCNDRPVLDIALEEGFNSKASFNRAFKLYTGATPTQFRRRANAVAPVSTSG